MKKFTICGFCFLASLLWSSCDSPRKEPESDEKQVKTEAASFLQAYTDKYVALYYDLSNAEWESNTHIEAGDTMNAYRTQQANEAYSSYTGSEEVIQKTNALLEKKASWNPYR